MTPGPTSCRPAVPRTATNEQQTRGIIVGMDPPTEHGVRDASRGLETISAGPCRLVRTADLSPQPPCRFAPCRDLPYCTD